MTCTNYWKITTTKVSGIDIIVVSERSLVHCTVLVQQGFLPQRNKRAGKYGVTFNTYHLSFLLMCRVFRLWLLEVVDKVKLMNANVEYYHWPSGKYFSVNFIIVTSFRTSGPKKPRQCLKHYREVYIV